MQWEIMNGSDHCCFFGCIQATANVLTASNTEAGLVVTHDYKGSIKCRLDTFKENKETRPRLLALANVITCMLPEIPRDIAFIPSVPKRVQRWRVS